MPRKTLQFKFKVSPLERHQVSRMKFSDHSRHLTAPPKQLEAGLEKRSRLTYLLGQDAGNGVLRVQIPLGV